MLADFPFVSLGEILGSVNYSFHCVIIFGWLENDSLLSLAGRSSTLITLGQSYAAIEYSAGFRTILMQLLDFSLKVR